MGFYYKTLFYYDVNDLTNYIELAQLDPIIENKEKKLGYVSKTELIQFVNKYYPDIYLTEDMITDNSYMIEYCTCTLSHPPSVDISCKLPVK